MNAGKICNGNPISTKRLKLDEKEKERKLCGNFFTISEQKFINLRPMSFLDFSLKEVAVDSAV